MWSSLFFIKVDFFWPQTEQFDKSINLFCLVFLTFELSFPVYFLQLTRYVCFVTYNQAINFAAFHFIMLSDLNSNPYNLAEIFLISVFSVDRLICQNISLTALKISKSSLSGSIYNQVLVLLLFVFLFRSQYFFRCVHFHQFLLQAYIIKI